MEKIPGNPKPIPKFRAISRHKISYNGFLNMAMPESDNPNTRYIYIYSMNPYILFLILILLILGFNPPYQLIIYEAAN